MLLIHRLSPLMRSNQLRLYGKKYIKPKKMSNMLAGNPPNKQVHQETMRYIYPFARINIRTDIYLKVKAADVHEYPDANVLIAELHGGHARNCPVNMHVDVSEDERLVNIVINKDANALDFHCNLEIPIRSDLHIEANDSVTVRNIFSSEINVRAQKNIETKEIRADNLTLDSAGGNISCKGMLLGRVTVVETKDLGNISLDKLQGDQLTCKTDAGNITTNSCYVEESKFVTNTGSLQLKNVHKRTEVDVQKSGELNMTGVHGNLTVRTNGGKLNLQLSELAGENVVKANGIEQAIINISECIEEQSNIEVTSRAVVLDGSLSHLEDCVINNHTLFRNSKSTNASSNLIVHSSGEVKLGKLSWMDSLREQLDRSEHK
ncbi:protein FAM185A [Zeugodacus cucurbitae]|uniref:Protein FAM185A n=1 Tax=Zeugodacus cucurbitae TaxID=28588 RepID=A0A0A1WN18_ZEUCU|nr:protein FAM185A [Zeugodacus cucurbitae]